MEHSLAEAVEVTCSTCGRKFNPEIWFIVDTADRPGLVDRIRRETLHRFTCPDGHTNTVDVPLLIYRPGERYLILFSPAENAGSKESELHGRNLLRQLRESFGDSIPSELDSPLALVARPLLPAVLRDGIDAAFDALHKALLLFVQANTPSGPRRIIEHYPELLTFNAEMMLGQIIERHGNVDSPYLQRLVERKALLKRFRESGLENAAGATTGASHTAREPDPIQAIIERARTPDELEAALSANAELFSAAAIDAALAQAMQPAGSIPAELAEAYRQAANALERHKRIGDQQDLAEALATCQFMLSHSSLAASPELFRALVLDATGGAFMAQHRAGGPLEDLDRAIASWEEARHLAQVTVAQTAGLLSNLAIAFCLCYEATRAC
jgi:hypothetical protein